MNLPLKKLFPFGGFLAVSSFSVFIIWAIYSVETSQVNYKFIEENKIECPVAYNMSVNILKEKGKITRYDYSNIYSEIEKCKLKKLKANILEDE